MANKREFKKYAEALASAVATQLAALYMVVEDPKEVEELEKELVEILASGRRAAARANAKFDKGVRAFNGNEHERNKEKYKFYKALYTNINKDLNEKIQEGIKLLNKVDKPA